VEGYRFKTRLRVRYSEVDAQRIVFNSNYLTYLDIAVGEYFREGLQLDLAELEEKEIFDYVLKKVTLNYNKSATMYDWLNIWCRTVKIGNTSMVMEFAITRDGEEDPLLTAEIIYVSYNPRKKATQPIPDIVRQAIEKLEHMEK